MAKINHKHKTVGVSLHPMLRQRAGRRARQQGMSFSRYVSLCVEAEVAGRVSLAGLPQPAAEAEAEGILCEEAGVSENADERLRHDVADVLRKAGVSFVRSVALGNLRADFRIDGGGLPDCAQQTHGAAGTVRPERGERIADDAGTVRYERGGGVASDTETVCSERGGGMLVDTGTVRPGRGGAMASDTETVCSEREGGVAADTEMGRPEGGQSIVVECCHPSAQNHAELLGRAVMLQQICGSGAVLLCVPYLSLLEPSLRTVFARQKIAVVTPDTLLRELRQALAGAKGAGKPWNS